VKIAILSRYAVLGGGGASRFAEDLACWLGDAGHEVTHFCAFSRGPLRSFQRPVYPGGLGGKVCRQIHLRTRQLGLAEAVPVEYWLNLRDALRGFDVLHFHDLHAAIAPQTLRLFSADKRVFFTAHDCSAYTGGCLYPMGCERWRHGCGGCPQVRDSEAEVSMGMFDFTATNFRRYAKLRRGAEIQHICPSRWMMDFALQHRDFRSPVHHIPNGFDPSPYRYASREEARDRLGLPSEARVITVAAANLGNKRKGIHYALEAITANQGFKPIVIMVGNIDGQVSRFLGRSGIRHWYTGFLEDRVRFGLILAAADLSLNTSLDDNLPISIQETMAAGTPVVGFASGGIPELVTAGETGWLVPRGDQDSLNHALSEALRNPQECAARGERARQVIATRFSVEGCVGAHEQLYAGARPSSNATQPILEAQTV
jgi:glycosyltransferase involved in cell wall biosynthesis